MSLDANNEPPQKYLLQEIETNSYSSEEEFLNNTYATSHQPGRQKYCYPISESKAKDIYEKAGLYPEMRRIRGGG